MRARPWWARANKIMTEQTIRLFVESWTMCWTLVLGLGYIGQTMALPGLSVLGGNNAARALVAASMVIVLGLCVAGFAAAALSIAGWTIGINLIRKTVTD
jgi:hypothetical protein